MASVGHGSNSRRVCAKILSTSFKWTLQYSTLEESSISPLFELAQSDKCCYLGFTRGKDKIACASIYFPFDLKFHALKTSMSIVDECDRKKMTRSWMSTERLWNDKEHWDYSIIDFELLSTEDITAKNGWLHDDMLTLLCEITLIKNVNRSSLELTDQIIWSQSTMPAKINEYLDNSNLCDVTFAIGDTELRAHKVILAAHSPVFEAMFTVEMSEQLNNRFNIEDVDANVFKAFLTCLYTKSIAKMDNFIDKILILSIKYKIESMKNMCEDYINKHLDCENAIDYLLLAHIHGINSLKKIVLPFVDMYQKTIAKSANFVKLCQYPDLVAEMFRTIAD